MQVTVEYAAQVKQAAGVGSETVELDEGSSVRDLILRVADRHGDPLRRVILGGDGNPHPSILLFVDDNQIRWDSTEPLRDANVVTLLSPVSGG